MPRLRLALRVTLGCRRCGSRRNVRASERLCRDCRPRTELDRYLERRGISLTDLATKAGIGRSTIARLVAGDVVGAATLARVAEVTGIPVDRLRPSKEVLP